MPSLNILLTSTAWRNDHNGFSHQGPGLIQNVITQRGSVGRVYLPPDANTLLSVADHCLRSRSYVNLVVIDKQPQLQWLSIDDAIAHCARGAGVWAWAGTDDGTADPDIVLACAGDVVTMETVAAASILRETVAPAAYARGQRRRPDGDDASQGPSARHGRHAVQRAVHRPRRRRVRLPRLPRRHPPAGARPAGRRQVPRAGLHRGGDDDHPVRHGGAQQGFPVPPGDGCPQQRAADSPRSERPHGMVPTAARQTTRPTSSSTSRTCPRCATGFSAIGPRRVDHVRR